MIFYFNWVISRFHVSFQGCKCLGVSCLMFPTRDMKKKQLKIANDHNISGFPKVPITNLQ